MKAATVLFLLLISFALTAAEDDRVVVGKVMHASKDGIELDRIGDTLSIGFVGEADALRSLEKITHEVHHRSRCSPIGVM